MFGLLVNTYCNGSCPYCFAKSAMDGKQINIDKIDLLAKIYKRYDQPIVSYFGGEPTLHPFIIDIINKFGVNNLISVIHSNALMENDILKKLVKTDIKMVLNINTKEVYSADKYDLLTKNVDELSYYMGPRIRLGVNFYKTGQDIESILDILKKTQFDKHVRIGLANPILDEANKYAAEKDIPEIGNEIYEFIRHILGLGYSPFFDCSFRHCMFENSKLEFIKDNIVGPLSHASCYQMFTIYPDITLSPCVALKSYTNRFKFVENTDFRWIYNYYEKQFAKYSLLGNLEKCGKCDKFKKECNGGCLSRTILNTRQR